MGGGECGAGVGVGVWCWCGTHGVVVVARLVLDDRVWDYDLDPALLDEANLQVSALALQGVQACNTH